MIDSADVSVVVQGGVHPVFTPRCLTSLRKFLPRAEIILSTWQGGKVGSLTFDQLVMNRDPGGAVCARNGRDLNNCNREIVSTFGGILKAGRRYVFKVRSDIVLKSDAVLRQRPERFRRDPAYALTRERLVVCSIYSRLFARKDDRIFPILFHPSDWVYFGLREDLYDLFDIPLTDEPGFSMWFENRPARRGRFTDAHPHRLWRFSPEAYIWTSYMRKKTGLECLDKLDISARLMRLSRRSLVNNFYMVDQDELGINLEKYNINQSLMPVIDREGLYSNYVWQKEYKKFCDRSHFVIPSKTALKCRLADIFHSKRNRR